MSDNQNQKPPQLPPVGNEESTQSEGAISLENSEASQEVTSPQTNTQGTEEQEAATKIVNRTEQSPIFDSATVIKPFEMSASEVTRYFKQLHKDDRILKENPGPGLTPFAKVQPPPEFTNTNTVSRRVENRRKTDRGNTRSSEFDFSRVLRAATEIPVWAWGAGIVAVVVFLLTMSGADKKITLPTNFIEKSSVAEDAAIIQLKVEFLSDLHKNIEATKSHAPQY